MEKEIKQSSKHESAFTQWFVRQDYDFEEQQAPSTIGEWFENSEYSVPVRKVSLPSLRDTIDKVVKGTRQISRQISARRK